MLNVVKNWFQNTFSDEEAVIFFILLLLLMSVIVLFGAFLAPVLTAVVIAYLMQGLVAWLERHNIRKEIAFSSVYALFIGILGVFMFVVLPKSWGQLIGLFTDEKALQKAQDFIGVSQQSLSKYVPEAQAQDWMSLANEEIQKLAQSVLSFSISNIDNVMYILIFVVLVPVLVFFFLKDKDQIVKWIVSFLPQERTMMTRVWSEMDEQISNYVRGKALEIIIVGLVTYGCFFVLGVNYAALLSLLVGLSVVIPYIGAAVVTVPVMVVAYVQFGWGGDFLWVMVTYAVIQALDGNVLVPLIFSEVVSLHPVAIIVAVLVFGGIWGLWGVFFAIPLATLIKAVLSAWPKRYGSDDHDWELDDHITS